MHRLLPLLLLAFFLSHAPSARAEALTCEEGQSKAVLVTAESTRPWTASVGRLLPPVYFRGMAFPYLGPNFANARWWHRINLPSGGTGALPAWETMLTCVPTWAMTRNLYALPHAMKEGQTAVVTAAAVTLRNEPTNDKLAWFDFTRLGELHRGTVVRVMGKSNNGWLKVRPYSLAETQPWFVQAHDLYGIADPGPSTLISVTQLEEVRGAKSLLLSASRPLPVLISNTGQKLTMRILVDRVSEEARSTVASMGGWINTGQVVLPVTWNSPYWGHDHGWTFEDAGATFWLVGKPPPAPPPLGWKESLEGLKVVIDPGHGAGFDLPGWKEGGRSKHRGVWYREEKIVLDIALQARDALEAKGATVYMTRTGPDPSMMSLPSRPSYARQVGADLFISVHSNAGPPGAHGVEVYYYNGFSQQFAQVMLKTLAAYQRNKPRKAAYATFSVVRPAWMPSILVETAYHSNSLEASMLVNPEFHKRSGEGIAQGVQDYLVKVFSSTP